MALQEANKVGRAKILKSTGLLLILFLFVFMLRETNGDFANGILFFLQAILNIHFLAILTILFALTFVFGSRAGREIIIHKKSIAVTSLKYKALIILAIIIYIAVVGIVNDKITSEDNFKRLMDTYLLPPLINIGLLATIPMLMAWLWATNQMKLAGASEK